MCAQVSLMLLSLLAVLLFSGNVKCQSYPNWNGMLQFNSCSVIAGLVEEESISKFTIRFYYGENGTNVEEVPLNNSVSLLDHLQFNISSPMIVYMSGWGQVMDSPYTNQSIQAFVGNCNCNFLMVDWTTVSINPLYNAAVSMTPGSGKAIAKALDAMIDEGATLNILTGLSLGGQVVGHIGRNLRNKVKHIVAMDPAGPLFYPPLQCADHINADDADCVEVIHTDAGYFGAARSSGDIDFWVNGGSRIQPGCLIPTDGQPPFICSHARSQYIYVQTYRNPELFPARKCGNWLEFQFNQCNDNNIAYIGQCNNESLAGDYYIRTTGFIPFGLGEVGTKPPFSLR